MQKGFSIINMFYFLFIIGFMLGCDNEKKWEHLKTENITEKVFVERFYKSYGVHSGGSQKYFVTDSSTYRFSVGTCDDKQYFTMKVDDSVLTVEKYSRRNLKNGESKIIETKTYDLEDY